MAKQETEELARRPEDLISWLDTVREALGEDAFDRAELNFSVGYVQITSQNEVYEFYRTPR